VSGSLQFRYCVDSNAKFEQISLEKEEFYEIINIVEKDIILKPFDGILRLFRKVCYGLIFF